MEKLAGESYPTKEEIEELLPWSSSIPGKILKSCHIFIEYSSERMYNISDEVRAMREKYQIEIEKRINGFESDYAFTALDFADMADTDPTNKALSRLCEDGSIRRIIQGVYYKPTYSKLLNEYSAPSIEKVAKALARKFNWTIAPSGDTALNYLHLSTQVPNKWCYISDGPYRSYEVGPYCIEFKHCANKEISGRSYITITVIQALKCIGKNNIQPEDIDRLASVLSEGDKGTILQEAVTTTAWVYRLLKEVCTS